MSLESTAEELKDLAHDARSRGGIYTHYSAPGSDLAEHLSAMADEIEEAAANGK